MKKYAVTAASILMILLMTSMVSCSNEAGSRESGSAAVENTQEKVAVELIEVASAAKEDEKTPAGEADKEKKVTEEKITPQEAVEALKAGAGIYAVIDTNMGRIICELYPKIAPEGVANFVGLAEGTKEFTHPGTGEKMTKPYYDGLIFHRVIPNFMIQGGDPLGKGFGGPGYKFKNEVSREVLFDRPGRLAYANAGPDTNGSQFFITHNPTHNLNGGYTIFGQTIQGQEVVTAIGDVKRDSRDKPLEDVVMEKVTIVRIEEKK